MKSWAGKSHRLRYDQSTAVAICKSERAWTSNPLNDVIFVVAAIDGKIKFKSTQQKQ